MRNRFLLIAALAGGLIVSCNLSAQVSLRLNINLDRQPVWGPTGYDHVEYYYLPEIEAYYNVSQKMFFYNDNGHWIGRSQLPYRFRDFDFFRSYKVVVNEPAPYLHHDKYRALYSSYRGRHDQEPIRDSHDSKYFVNRNHPQHDRWMRQREHDHRNETGTVVAFGVKTNLQGEQENGDNSAAGTMRAGVDANINDQPMCGPTGYDRPDYYYIPEINSYYSISASQYIYWEGSEWLQAASLPPSYSTYDPYNSYKVVLNEPRPFWNNETHRARYGVLRDNRDQPMIRDSHDPKYLANQDHPEHDAWMDQQNRGNANDIALGEGDNDASEVDSRDGPDSLESDTIADEVDGNKLDANGSLSVESVNGGAAANISDQPMWGPTGYDRADYYYLPDINSYYSIPEHQYIYWDRSVWVRAASLPAGYSYYDPYNSYKVVLNEPNPYLNNESHQAKYGSFRGNRDQPLIRNSHDHKYFANRDHPEHATWVREQRR